MQYLTEIELVHWPSKNFMTLTYKHYSSVWEFMNHFSQDYSGDNIIQDKMEDLKKVYELHKIVYMNEIAQKQGRDTVYYELRPKQCVSPPEDEALFSELDKILKK